MSFRVAVVVVRVVQYMDEKDRKGNVSTGIIWEKRAIVERKWKRKGAVVCGLPHVESLVLIQDYNSSSHHCYLPVASLSV